MQSLLETYNVRHPATFKDGWPDKIFSNTGISTSRTLSPHVQYDQVAPFRAKEVSTRVRFLFEERWWAATVREATVGSCFFATVVASWCFQYPRSYGYCLIYLDIVSIHTDSCCTIIKLVKPFQLPSPSWIEMLLLNVLDANVTNVCVCVCVFSHCQWNKNSSWVHCHNDGPLIQMERCICRFHHWVSPDKSGHILIQTNMFLLNR